MSLMIFSCNKTEETPVTPIRDFTEQYNVDITAIDKYLDEYHMDIVDNTKRDVAFTKIPTPNPANLQSIRSQFASNLHTKIVASNGVNYKVYYLNITKDSDPNYYGSGENPTRVDSVFVSYKGHLLNETVFDQAENPVWFPLDNVIRGWQEIMPFFKTGDANPNPSDGTVSYSNFGAGVMFLPSGLGYYNGGVGSIPSYSPLIFSFKLKGLNYVDHDRDHIDSRFEDLNANGIFTDDHTDGDGRPDYLDIDDDADGIPTKTEIRISPGVFYDFANIPLCTDGKKKHLSATCR